MRDFSTVVYYYVYHLILYGILIPKWKDRMGYYSC